MIDKLQLKGKYFHIMSACSVLLSYAINDLKNSIYYKQKTKKLLNLLLKENENHILEQNKLKDLLVTSEDGLNEYRRLTNEASLEKEDMIEDLTVSQHIIFLFVNIFYKSNEVETTNLFSILNSLNKGERVFTKGDMYMYSKRLLKKYTNLQLDEESLKKWINEETNRIS